MPDGVVRIFGFLEGVEADVAWGNGGEGRFWEGFMIGRCDQSGEQKIKDGDESGNSLNRFLQAKMRWVRETPNERLNSARHRSLLEGPRGAKRARSHGG